MRQLISAGLLVFLLSGCALFNNPERSAHSVLALSHSGVETAIEGWNEFLGTERVRIAALTEEERTRRILEIQHKEKQLILALAEYNKSLASARITVDKYYAIKDSLGSQEPTEYAKVRTVVNAVVSAGNGMIDIIRIWVPTLTAKKTSEL